MSHDPRQEEDPIARALARKRSKQKTFKQADYQDIQQMITEAVREHQEREQQQQQEEVA